MRKMYFFVLWLIATQTVFSQVVDLEDLTLQPNSYWNGSDNSGGFTSSNIASFPNTFVDWGGGVTSWSGFAYSNMLDTVTQSFMNQYSCFAGVQTTGSSIFGISYNNSDWATGQIIPNVVTFSQPIKIQSLDVTNTTYSALTMRNGDSYSKKFGGVDGNDPDWFKLTIKGYNQQNLTGEVEFYLADYRFTNNQLDYILKDWTTVDLSTLGTITSLSFSLSSSDTGMYGMNTPAYFCFDNIRYEHVSQIANHQSELSLNIYPNPVHNLLYINTNADYIAIFDIAGTKRIEKKQTNAINIENLPAGIYTIEIIKDNQNIRKSIIKQ